MRIVPSTIVLAGAMALFVAEISAGELYKWTDERGELHIATSLADVPLAYRPQVLTVEKPSLPDPGLEVESDELPDPTPLETAELDEDPELQKFSIPYENEGTARRVIIPVKFNDRVIAPMALDTGSPGMMISADLAERLGLFSSSRDLLFTQAGGVGGETPAILTIIDSVSVEGARDEFIPTLIVGESVSDAFDGLIGMDFLANYSISIDAQEQVVVFKEIVPSPEARGGHDEAWWRSTFSAFQSAHDGWLEYAETHGGTGSRLSAFLDHQVEQSRSLLMRLDRYASQHAVPRYWR